MLYGNPISPKDARLYRRVIRDLYGGRPRKDDWSWSAVLEHCELYREKHGMMGDDDAE